MDYEYDEYDGAGDNDLVNHAQYMLQRFRQQHNDRELLQNTQQNGTQPVYFQHEMGNLSHPVNSPAPTSPSVVSARSSHEISHENREINDTPNTSKNGDEPSVKKNEVGRGWFMKGSGALKRQKN